MGQECPPGSSVFVKYFHVAVLQKDTNTRAVILPVCTAPLNTEENVLPPELFFTLASFHCRLFKYGSFSVSTGHRYRSLEKTKLLLHRGHQRLGLRPKCQKPLDSQYIAAAYFLPGKSFIFLLPLAIKLPLIPTSVFLPRTQKSHTLSGSAMSVGAWVLKWLLSWQKEWPNDSVQQRATALDSQSTTAVSWLPYPTPSDFLQLEHQVNTVGVAL